MLTADLLEDAQRSIRALAEAPLDLATPKELGALLKVASEIRARLDGVIARGLTTFADVGGPEEFGAPSVKAWARREMRLDTDEIGRFVAAGRTMRALPAVAESQREGRIRLAHVHEFTAGLKKADPIIVTAGESYLLGVAERSEPRALKSEIREFIEAIHPEVLDEAYIRGMDKRDLQVSKVGDGYAVTGFLDILTGAKLKAVVDHLGAPADRNDTRSPSERRVGNLDQLLTSVLEHGLPSRKGFNPQVYVTVDLDRLQGSPGAEPARLHGWGTIPDMLLGTLLCGADVTSILTSGMDLPDSCDEHNHWAFNERPTADVLNVGRTQRLATKQQRIAIKHRQGGQCANPGCSNTHLEIHHVDFWHRDLGRTDLADLVGLVGLCPRCHHLLHAGLLGLERGEAEGSFVFSTGDGRPIGSDPADDRRRGFERLLIKRKLREIRYRNHVARRAEREAEREKRGDAAAA